MSNLKDILEDLEFLSNIKNLAIEEVEDTISSFKTEDAGDYLVHMARKVKPETALSDDIIKRIMDRGGYLNLNASPQVLSGKGWVDFLLNPPAGNPVAIELKPLHKIRGHRIVFNNLEQEYLLLKDDDKNQVKEYLRHYDYVILTNAKDAYYFNREAIIDFKPFLQEEFANLVNDLSANNNIWDVIRRKEDRTPKHDLDKKFFADLKKWYVEFDEVAFKHGVRNEEKIVLLLNKFIFLKTLEDYGLVTFNLIRRTFDQKDEAWRAKGRKKVFCEFFKELNNWAYAYYDTELFREDFFSLIEESEKNLETLEKAFRNVLGYSDWLSTHWIGLSYYNYRNINEDIFGKAYETFLAERKKEQGIFYTPSEITEYMSSTVVEELFGPLKRGLINAIEIQDFVAAQKYAEQLIELKILDPACGSGSFLVKILKLIWENVYTEIDRETRWVTQVSEEHASKGFFGEPKDLVDRKNSIKNIRELLGIGRDDFNGVNAINAIILRHIYGVDFDDKAIDVAKVNIWKEAVKLSPSCFRASSLPADINHVLPNLEMNFVVANTLLDLSVDESLSLLQRYRDDLVQLIQIRNNYLSNPQSPEVLNKVREIKDKLRKTLNRAFRKKKYPIDSFALFAPLEFFFNYFDSEGNPLPEPDRGFNGVIGNPPYVRADSGDEHLALRQSIEKSGLYETLWEKWDLFIPFMERGYKLLKRDGYEMMIVSDAYCHSKYAQKSQNWFLKNGAIKRIDFLSKLKIFEEAAVHNVICLFQKNNGDDNKPERLVHEKYFGDLRILESKTQNMLTYRVFFPESEDDSCIELTAITLSQICYITKGMVVNADERKARGEFEMKDLVSNIKDEVHFKPFVEGKNLDRWLPINNRWLEWDTDRAPGLFSRPTFPEMYEVKEKILVQRSPGPDPKACYDEMHLYFTESSVGFVPWNSLHNVRNKSIQKSARYPDEKQRGDLPNRQDLEEISRRFEVKYLLAVMNSTAARDYLRANRRSNIHLYPDDWKKLPIPEASKDQQDEIIELVNHILKIKRETPASLEIEKLEIEIDKKVFALYKDNKNSP